MLVREQRYNAQEALKKIWNDSGNEEDFDSDEKKVELYELVSKDKIGKHEDASGTMGACSKGVKKQAIWYGHHLTPCMHFALKYISVCKEGHAQ